MKDHMLTPTVQARPLIARIQPVTWLVIGLLVMFAGLAGLTIARKRERAAGQVGQPMTTLVAEKAVADAAQQQATRTPRPSATARPTRTPRPTADATAAFFKQLDAQQTAAVRTATVEAKATQAIATFTPMPPTPTIYPAGYRAPWADKMVKQADGTWMAPKEVVDLATKQSLEYYDWLRTKDVKFIQRPVSEQLAVYKRYLAGRRLAERANYVAERTWDGIHVDPSRYSTRVLRVKEFSQDGLSAVIDVEFLNSQWNEIDRATGQKLSEYSIPDEIESYRIVYDPSDGRWKGTGTFLNIPVRKP